VIDYTISEGVKEISVAECTLDTDLRECLGVDSTFISYRATSADGGELPTGIDLVKGTAGPVIRIDVSDPAAAAVLDIKLFCELKYFVVPKAQGECAVPSERRMKDWSNKCCYSYEPTDT
jgi:hypothetical protein